MFLWKHEKKGSRLKKSCFKYESLKSGKCKTLEELNAGNKEKFLNEQRVRVVFIPKVSDWTGHHCELKKIRLILSTLMSSTIDEIGTFPNANVIMTKVNVIRFFFLLTLPLPEIC